MKIYHYLQLLFAVCIFYSCGSNVEELDNTNCDPEPVVHEILWSTSMDIQTASLTIKPGDTVRWIWDEENMPHDVFSEDENAPEDFNSEIITGAGTIYEYTFTEETVFNYECSVHPTTMYGTITVTECIEDTEL